MAVAKTQTRLSLDHFAQIMGLNPLHFNQVHIPGFEAQVCGEPLFQYSWQWADRVGREEIAQAIAEAERTIEDNTYYNVLPSFTIDETQTIDKRLIRPSAKTTKGYFVSGGRQKIDTVATGVAITWGTADTLGYKRFGTVTQVVTFTDIQELAIYYPGHNGDPAWRIEPKSLTIISGSATIIINRERTVKETFFETYDSVESKEATEDSNFLTTVDISRVYIDPSNQVTFVWEGGCACGSTTGCQYATQTGYISARDYVNGIVVFSPGTWDTTTLTFQSQPFNPCRMPDIVRFSYLSGWQDQSLTMPRLVLDEQWARAVSYLAVTMLDRPICNCNALEKITQYYAEDLAKLTEIPKHISMRRLDNPIGTTRAAINAWNLINNRSLGQGVVSV